MISEEHLEKEEGRKLLFCAQLQLQFLLWAILSDAAQADLTQSILSLLAPYTFQKFQCVTKHAAAAAAATAVVIVIAVVAVVAVIIVVIAVVAVAAAAAAAAVAVAVVYVVTSAAE